MCDAGDAEFGVFVIGALSSGLFATGAHTDRSIRSLRKVSSHLEGGQL